jgi:hypothetical protein
VNLPSADDLFRPTSDAPEDAVASRPVRAVPEEPEPAGARKHSGRVRHDEKMTVYITSDELLELEHARLSLRRAHGIAIDRGRLVRAAVSLVLADLEENGEASALVRRLAEE